MTTVVFLVYSTCTCFTAKRVIEIAHDTM